MQLLYMNEVYFISNFEPARIYFQYTNFQFMDFSTRLNFALVELNVNSKDPLKYCMKNIIFFNGRQTRNWCISSAQFDANQ